MQKIVLDDIKYDLVIFKYRAFIKDPFEFFLSCQVFGFSKLETHFHRLAEGRNEVNGFVIVHHGGHSGGEATTKNRTQITQIKQIYTDFHVFENRQNDF